MIAEELKKIFKSGSALTKLIYINIAVFLFYHIAHLFFYLFAAGDHFKLYSWLAVPSNMETLLTRPWTLITYMFFHTEFFHILFNMLWLYWFGRIFLSYFSNRQMISVYLWGGVVGAIFYIAAYNIFPVFAVQKYSAFALGASAAVIAIVSGISVYVPNYTINLLFLGRIKLIYIALFTIVLDIISISVSNAGGHIAHLGGAFFGYLFASNIKKGVDITAWFSSLRRKIKKLFKRKPKMKAYTNTKPPVDDREYNRQKHATQQEIDHILDKISKSGYEGLTQKEKEILFSQKK